MKNVSRCSTGGCHKIANLLRLSIIYLNKLGCFVNEKKEEKFFIFGVYDRCSVFQRAC